VFFLKQNVTNAEYKTASESISLKFLTVFYGRLFTFLKKVVTEAFDSIHICAVRERITLYSLIDSEYYDTSGSTEREFHDFLSGD
jgi:hypothetical protein